MLVIVEGLPWLTWRNFWRKEGTQCRLVSLSGPILVGPQCQLYTLSQMKTNQSIYDLDHYLIWIARYDLYTRPKIKWCAISQVGLWFAFIYEKDTGQHCNLHLLWGCRGFCSNEVCIFATTFERSIYYQRILKGGTSVVLYMLEAWFSTSIERKGGKYLTNLVVWREERLVEHLSLPSAHNWRSLSIGF